MDFQAKFNGIISSYVKTVRDDFAKSITGWQADEKLRDMQAVFGGLLSRQCLLGTMLARRLDYFDHLIAPLILRAMLESTINMAWMSLSPVDRTAKFISYGLGQSKLALEHARNLESLFQGTMDVIDSQALWLNSQRHEIFTDVNVGQWSDMDLERMAREADVHKYYSCYSAMSPASHGSWDHVFQLFLDTVDAAAKPHIPNPILAPLTIYMAGQNVEAAFGFFRKVAGQVHDAETYRKLCRDLQSLRKAG